MPDHAPNLPEVPQPTKKRAIVFFDAQNFYFSTQEVFGAREPNFDPVLLSQYVCDQRGLDLKLVCFYTGVPGAQEQSRWHGYWTAKLRRLRNQKVEVFSRPIRYRYKQAELPITAEVARWVRLVLPNGSQLPRGPITVLTQEGRELPPGSTLSVQIGEEKGIDVRLALDLIRYTLDSAFDVGILFTQDQDHAVTVDEAKRIARQQNRSIELLSVYPDGCQNKSGVTGTTWITINEETYRACIDPKNYFPR